MLIKKIFFILVLVLVCIGNSFSQRTTDFQPRIPDRVFSQDIFEKPSYEPRIDTPELTQKEVITTEQLQDRSVTSNKIAIQNVKNEHLNQEIFLRFPRISYTTIGGRDITATTSSSQFQEIASVRINVPVNGVVIVEVTGEVYLKGNGIGAEGHFNISNTKGDRAGQLWIRMTGNNPAGTIPFHIRNVFNISQEGLDYPKTHTFYLNGARIPSDIVSLRNIIMTATFLPNNVGMGTFEAQLAPVHAID